MTESKQRQGAPADDNVSVLRDYSGPGDVLLVSFSGLKRNPHKVPGFSLRGTLTGLPAKKLYLRDLNKAWFLRGLCGVTSGVEDTVSFLRSEVEAVGARRVIMTGYSLGGFAALLYGTMMGANEVHAISPQTFISFWRRFRCGDRRWQRYVLPLHFGSHRRFHDLRPLFAGEAAGTQLHIYFAGDSRLDTLHAQHLQTFPQVTLHEHAKGAHRLVSLLRQSGELRAILERAVAGESLRAPAGKG